MYEAKVYKKGLSKEKNNEIHNITLQSEQSDNKSRAPYRRLDAGVYWYAQKGQA